MEDSVKQPVYDDRRDGSLPEDLHATECTGPRPEVFLGVGGLTFS